MDQADFKKELERKDGWTLLGKKRRNVKIKRSVKAFPFGLFSNRYPRTTATGMTLPVLFCIIRTRVLVTLTRALATELVKYLFVATCSTC